MPVEKEKRKKPDSERMTKIANERGYKFAYPVMVGRENYIMLSNEREGTSFHDIRVASKENRLLKPNGARLEDMDKEKLRSNMIGTGIPKVVERVVEKPEETKTDYSFSFRENFDEYTQNKVETELGKDGFEALEAHINGNYEKVEALEKKNKVMHPDFAWKTQIIAECLETDSSGNYSLHGRGAHILELMKASPYQEEKIYDPSKKAVDVLPMEINGRTYQFMERYLGPEMAKFAYQYFNKPDKFAENVAPSKIGGITRIFEKMKKDENGLYYIPENDLKDLESRMKETPEGYTIAEKEEYPEELEGETEVAEVIKPKEEYPEKIEEEAKVAEVIKPEKKYPEELEGELEKPEVIMPEEETRVAEKEEYPEEIEGETKEDEIITPETEEKPAMVAKKEEYPEELEGEKEAEAVIGPEEKKTLVAAKDEEIDITPAILEEKEVKAKEFGSGEKIAPKTKQVTLLVVGPEGTERQKIIAEFDPEFYSKNIATAPNQKLAVLASIDDAVNITLDGEKISSKEAKELIKSG